MNKEFVQINDTDYVVSNNDGELNLIKSNNNNTIEEILIKENKIEKVTELITNNNNQLEYIKFIDKFRKILNLILILSTVIFSFSMTYWGFIKTLILCSLIFCIIRLPFTAIFGTKLLNKNKIKTLTTSIESDSQKVETLTKELEELKAKSNYQKMPYSETHIAPMKQPTKEYIKYKVKRLVPNKEK